MINSNWSRLSKNQLGKYGEYFVKMEFTRYGFDVFTSEVDEKGIDFVVKKDNKYYDVQVKSRRKNNNYIFAQKSKFLLKENLIMAIVIFDEGKEPKILLIPSLEWEKKEKYPMLVGRNYEDKKSKPEWGININTKNLPVLENDYSFEKIINFYT